MSEKPVLRTSDLRVVKTDPEAGVTDQPTTFEVFQPFGSRVGPNFPVEMLPNTLANYVNASVGSFQMNSSAIAPWILGAVSGSVARKFEVQAAPGWREPLAIFAVVALPSASRKSAAISAISAPLYDYEQEKQAETGNTSAADKTRLTILERRAKTAESKAAQADGVNDEDLVQEAIEAGQKLADAKREASRVFRLISSNTTPERLLTLVAESGGRLVMISDEGDEVFSASSRYASNGGENIDGLLKCESAGTLRVDRANGTQINQPSAQLAMILGIQPVTLDRIASNQEFSRRGLLGRLFIAVPESTVGTRLTRPKAIPSHIENAYHSIIRKLLEIDSELVIIDMDSEAMERLETFRVEIEQRLVGDLESIPSWAGKLAGRVAKIAGLLHCVESAERDLFPAHNPISLATLERAIPIGRWALEHALAAFSGNGPFIDRDLRCWQWIVNRDDAHAEFSERELWQAKKGSTGTISVMRDVRDVLNSLEERGYIGAIDEPVSDGRPGRKPSRRYLPNPEAINHNDG